MTHRSTLILSSLSIVIMLVLYALSATGNLGANPVGQSGSYSSPLIVPAGYAFAIWSIIYTGIIAFPIFQWIKRQEGHHLWNNIRIWFAANALCNGIWLAVSSYNFLWTSVIVILFMLLSLYKINILLIQIKQEGGVINYWFEKFTFSIYFAWITLASVLNFSSALHFYQWEGFGLSQETWTLIMIPIAAIIAGIIARKYKDIAYAGVVIWAFVALIVKRMEDIPNIAYLSMIVVAVFAILIIMIGRDRLSTSS